MSFWSHTQHWLGRAGTSGTRQVPDRRKKAEVSIRNILKLDSNCPHGNTCASHLCGELPIEMVHSCASCLAVDQPNYPVAVDFAKYGMWQLISVPHFAMSRRSFSVTRSMFSSVESTRRSLLGSTCLVLAL